MSPSRYFFYVVIHKFSNFSVKATKISPEKCFNEDFSCVAITKTGTQFSLWFLSFSWDNL